MKGVGDYCIDKGIQNRRTASPAAIALFKFYILKVQTGIWFTLTSFEHNSVAVVRITEALLMCNVA